MPWATRAFLQRAEQIALAPGARWAEADKGTNAVGTALMTESPTGIFGQEHYLRALQFLTCAAAPLFDHKGALLGVINVSSDRRAYHPHTQALANLSARLIETQWFTDKFSRHLCLHLHPRASALGTLHEGVLALNEAGQVMGANRRAIELLGDTAHHLRRGGVQSLFDTDLSGLIDQARQHPEQALLLAFVHRGEPGHGEPIHARLSLGTTPAQRVGAAAPATPSTPSSAAQTGAAIVVPLAMRESAGLTESADSAEAEKSSASSDLAAAVGPPALLTTTATASGGTVQGEWQPAAKPAPTLRQAELLAIQAAVQNCGGNLALAARHLGIGRSTLYRKLKTLAVAAAAQTPSAPASASASLGDQT